MNNYSEPEKKEIKIRGWIAGVFTAVSIIITIALFFKFLGGDDPIHEVLAAAMLLGFVAGGLIPGISHLPSILNKSMILIAFPFIGWAIMICIIICIPTLCGWLFMLIDLVKFLLLKKEEK